MLVHTIARVVAYLEGGSYHGSKADKLNNDKTANGKEDAATFPEAVVE